ncbi:MAG: hypothetical protein NDJ92_18345 [Thermoanaerobaculia bacterium]|nr:hypothetical protein [Thermoanaerobaculia bacterium]
MHGIGDELSSIDPEDLTPMGAAAHATTPAPLSADDEVIGLRLQLFERDFASRLGRDPMAAGLALYGQLLRGRCPDPKAFADFVAMYPPTPGQGRPRAAAPMPAASAQPVERELSPIMQDHADRALAVIDDELLDDDLAYELEDEAEGDDDVDLEAIADDDEALS